MDATHLMLTQRPFPTTPDSSRYYPATSHERALAALQRALAEGEGLALLTGTPGTGKTLLCHCLVERVSPAGPTVFLTHTHRLDHVGFLQAMLFDLGLPYEGRSEQECRLALTEYLLANYATAGPALVIVDEAQQLGPELLEELRMLGNLEGRAGKAVQVILVGQQNLLDTLQRPEMASLRQRAFVRAMLEPLPLHEAADYLLHHLRVAGGRPEDVMPDETLEVLARGSGGVPRLLNQAAHLAMQLAREAEASSIDVEAALEALGRLGLDAELPPAEDAEVIPLPEDPAARVTPGRPA